MNRKQILDFLSNIELFSDLANSERQKLVDIIEVRYLKANEDFHIKLCVLCELCGKF